MARLDPRLLNLSSTQHGLLLRSQLRDLGLDRHDVARLLRNGTVERTSSVVFRLRGTPATVAQRRLAAVLDAAPSAALAHLSAARVWGMYRHGEGRTHVVRPRDGRHRHSPHLAIVHTSLRLPPDHLLVVEGTPVTTPARTVVDLATDQPLGRVARMLDNAWGHRLLSIGELAAVVDTVRASGRRGVRLLDHLIAERLGHVPAESALEIRFEQILRRHSLPPMRRQVDIGDDRGWICRADHALIDDGIVVFIDSATFHRAVLDRAHDDSQTVRLRAVGLTVLRFSDAQVLYDAAAVAHAIRTARAARNRAA